MKYKECDKVIIDGPNVIGVNVFQLGFVGTVDSINPYDGGLYISEGNDSTYYWPTDVKPYFKEEDKLELVRQVVEKQLLGSPTNPCAIAICAALEWRIEPQKIIPLRVVCDK